MLYSKSTGGFYDPTIHASIPTDAVQVSDSTYQALFAAQTAGKVITADASGNPVAVDPSTLLTLTQAQAAQVGKIAAAYATAIAQSVSFTSAGGVTKTFQADAQSVANLQAMLAACTPAGKTPTGFYWVSADNTQVPFTLADMQGLAQAIGAQGWAAFQQLQARKATILAATSVSSVRAVTW